MNARWSSKSGRPIRCEAASVSALVQQIAVQLVPRGYWYYVTGVIPEGRDPQHVDRSIIERYDIQEDPSGRRSAELKRRGIANVKYLRHGRFYVILATKGQHFFKLRERDRIRCLRKDRRAGTRSNMGRVEHIDLAFPYAPLLIPLDVPPRRKGNEKRVNQHRRASHIGAFEGYSISFRRGRFQRKTHEERETYRQQLADWKRNTALGKKLPKPDKGERDPKWRTHTEIEARSLKRLEAYFLEKATRRPAGQLATEFQSTPYEPYWAIKRQLLGILRKANRQRATQGLSELRYGTVLGMKRTQIAVFVEPRQEREEAA